MGVCRACAVQKPLLQKIEFNPANLTLIRCGAAIFALLRGVVSGARPGAIQSCCSAAAVDHLLRRSSPGAAHAGLRKRLIIERHL